MTTGRYTHTATLLGNGSVLVPGGYNAPDALLSVEIYAGPAAVAAPVITSGTPPGGTVGTAYSFTVIASGSPTFSATGLPPGLGIDPNSGVISGTPTTPGSFDATITATNAGGPTSANYTMVIAAAAVVATPTAVPTLSEWGTIALSLLVAGAAVLGLPRRG